MTPISSPAMAGWKYCVHRGSALNAGRKYADPAGKYYRRDARLRSPSTAYAISSKGWVISTAGIRNIDSDPRNQRITTTLDIADNTTDPRMPAVQRPNDFLNHKQARPRSAR